jgi:hypothetical protein
MDAAPNRSASAPACADIHSCTLRKSETGSVLGSTMPLVEDIANAHTRRG